MAHAFAAGDPVSDRGLWPKFCNIEIEHTPASSFAWVAIFSEKDWVFAGGSQFFIDPGPTSRTEMTKADVAYCLGTTEDKISYFVADGADGTFATDTLAGFGFVVSEKTGSFEANVFYTWTVGTGSLPPPPPSGPPPSATFAVQSLASTLASNRNLTNAARTRFMTSRGQLGGDGAGIASRNDVAFDLDGTVTALDSVLSTRGTFFEQRGTFDGTYRRLAFGDFDVQHDRATGGTTATANGTVAWERMLSPDTMAGVFIGGSFARSSMSQDSTSEQTKYGLTAGGFIVTALQENLFADGFVSFGLDRNALAVTSGGDRFESDYTNQTMTIGASLSGVINRGGYQILPEIAVSYGQTRIGDRTFTDATGAVDATRSLAASTVSIANVTVSPEFRVPLDGLSHSDARSVFSFAPRGICERVSNGTTTQGCGGGIELGLSSTSEDGLAQFNARVSADRVADTTRTALNVGFQYQF